MASFTDKAPTFNPYVQQQPVDAMVKVGMAKQQQYDQNLQGIQTTMNKIGSLNIIRDVDKEYLNGKMNEVTSKLTTFAAGDFSNANLTRSVAGMIGEVGSDETVQTAVMSTQRYQNEQKRIAKAQEEGNLTPDNLFHFQKQASPWLNGTQAGEQFNGKYVDHFDVLKYTREVFDDIKPDGYEYDDLFSGVDEAGNPVLSPALKRMQREGIMPEKVQMVVSQIFSDPRVSQQLSISGQYAYKDDTTETLQDKLFVQQTNSLKFIADQRAQLEVKRALGEDVQKDIDSLDSATQEVNSSFSDLMKQAKDNPDAVRGKIYTDQQRLKYNKMFTNVKESTTYHENPVWNGNFKIQQEANRMAIHRDDQILKWANHNLQKEKNANDYEIGMAKLVKEGTTAFTTGTAFPGQESSEFSLDNYRQAHLDRTARAFTSSSNDIIWQGNFRDEYWEEAQAMTMKGISQEQAIETILKREAKKNPKYITTNDLGEEVVNMDAFRTDYIDRIETEYNNTNTGPVDKNNPLLQQLYTYHESKENYLAAKEVNDAIDDMFSSEMKKLDTTGVYQKIKPITFGREFGGILNGVTLTPEDLLKISLIQEYGHGWNFSEDAKVKEKYAEDAEKQLIAKYGKDAYSSIEFLFGGSMDYTPNAPQSPLTSDLMKDLRDATKDIDFTEALRLKNNILKQTYSKRPNMVLPVGTGDLEQDRVLLNNLRALAETGEGSFGDPQNPSKNFSGFLKALNQDDTTIMKLSLKANIINDDKGETFVQLKQGTSNSDADMVITLDQARRLGMNVNALYEPDEITTLRMRLDRYNSTSKGNPGLKSTYLKGDAKFKNNDFPLMKNSKNYNVQANIEYVNGKYVPYIYYQKYDDAGKFLGDKLLVRGSDPDLGTVVEKLKQYVSPYFLSVNE